jgi:hypothetical protein
VGDLSIDPEIDPSTGLRMMVGGNGF